MEENTVVGDNASVLFLKNGITLYIVCILKLALLRASQHVYPIDVKTLGQILQA